MVKNGIIVSAILALAISTGGWATAHYNQNALISVADKQEVDIQEKSTEIANLEAVIVKEDKKSEADEIAIEELNVQLQKRSEIIEYVKNSNINMEKKLEKLKADLEAEKKKNKLKAIAKEKAIAQAEIVAKAEAQKEERSQPLQKSKSQVAVIEKKEKVSTVSRGDKAESGRVVNVVATSYIAMCDTGCTGITATGMDVRNTGSRQIIAVDPNVIPLGSKVKVTFSNGNSFYAVAEDTGGDIKGGRIDILMATYSEAVNFGRQSVKVTILREGR